MTQLRIAAITLPPPDKYCEEKTMTQAFEDPTSPVTISPKRGRRALPTTTADIAHTDAVADYTAAAAPVLAELRQNSVTLHKGELEQSLHMAQGMGMFQALNYIQQFSGIARLKWLAERKESCDYKGASVVGRDGTMLTIKTFEDLCDFVGHSYRKIHEDLQNLATFGEGLLEAQEALGLGYRELRRLRAGIKSLPPEEQQKVLDDMQAVEGSEEAKALLDDVRIKLAETEIALKDAKDDMAAKEKLSKAKSDRLDKLQEQIIKLTSVHPDEQEAARQQLNAEARKDLDISCHKVMGQLNEVLGLATAMFSRDDMDTATQQYVHKRVSMLCELMGQSILNVGIDVDFRLEFEVDYGDGSDADADVSGMAGASHTANTDFGG